MKLKKWNEYFAQNKTNTLAVVKDDHALTAEERNRISSSIQSFQLGESSEGLILKKQALRFCEGVGSYEYLEAIKHLIREENRHSAYLGQFMDLHQIGKIKKGINDTVFRFLRRLMGVEQSIRVLVTAEVIAITYYDCLSVATESNLLKQICKRMHDEEIVHVDFQMQQIHWMNFQKHALSSAVSNILHYFLFCTALVPVWLEHKNVLKMKYTFKSFFLKAKTDFVEATYNGQIVAAKKLVQEGFLKQEALCI